MPHLDGPAGNCVTSYLESEGEVLSVAAGAALDVPPNQPCNSRPSDVAVALRLPRLEWGINGAPSRRGVRGWSGWVPVTPGLDVVVAVPDSAAFGDDCEASLGSRPTSPIGGDTDSLSTMSISVSSAAAMAAAAAANPPEAFYVRVVVQTTTVKLENGSEYELRTVQLMPVISRTPIFTRPCTESFKGAWAWPVK